MGTGGEAVFSRVEQRGLEADDSNKMQRLRMVQLFLHSPYVFMAWCLINHMLFYAAVRRMMKEFAYTGRRKPRKTCQNKSMFQPSVESSTSLMSTELPACQPAQI
jgi:hypothetical protein